MQKNTYWMAAADGVIKFWQVLFKGISISCLNNVHAHLIQSLNWFVDSSIFLVIMCIVKSEGKRHTNWLCIQVTVLNKNVYCKLRRKKTWIGYTFKFLFCTKMCIVKPEGKRRELVMHLSFYSAQKHNDKFCLPGYNLQPYNKRTAYNWSQAITTWITYTRHEHWTWANIIWKGGKNDLTTCKIPNKHQ